MTIDDPDDGSGVPFSVLVDLTAATPARVWPVITLGWPSVRFVFDGGLRRMSRPQFGWIRDGQRLIVWVQWGSPGSDPVWLVDVMIDLP